MSKVGTAIVAKDFKCTHNQAVARAAAWLRNSKRFVVVMAERRCINVREQPDVIGWRGCGDSILIECKVSRSDFLADKNKVFRRTEDLGVGQLRYYAAPRGILKPDDMPKGWGLLEITEHQVRERVRPEPKESMAQAEVAMLVSAIRRLEMSATVFVCHEAAIEAARGDYVAN